MNETPDQEQQPMSRKDAIDYLEEGHSITSILGAQSICNALGVTLNPDLIMEWKTEKEALNRYSFFATKAPGNGVDILSLGYEVCKQLRIEPGGRRFSGKGYQARANAQSVREYFAAQDQAQQEIGEEGQEG